MIVEDDLETNFNFLSEIAHFVFNKNFIQNFSAKKPPFVFSDMTRINKNIGKSNFSLNEIKYGNVRFISMRY